MPPVLGQEDLARVLADVPYPDDWVWAAARRRQAELLKPPGSLGRLEDIGCWVAGVQAANPPHPFRRPRLLLVAGDHGIARAGVSAYPPAVTAAVVRAVLDGGAVARVLADHAGVGVRVLDLAVDDDLGDPEAARWKVRRGSGRIDVEDALTLEEASAAFRAGMAVVDEEVDAGADLLVLGEMGIGSTTPAAALVGVLTGADAAAVIGRGTGIDDRTWMRKCAAIRDAMRRGRPVQGDPVALLARIGGADLAATAGILLQAAVRRTPVLLDGVVSCACALLVHAQAPNASKWWLASTRSPEPAAKQALEWMALEPLLDLGLRLGEGTGGLLALPLVQAAAATLEGTALLRDLVPEVEVEQPDVPTPAAASEPVTVEAPPVEDAPAPPPVREAREL
ncbi:nicotinate-nucleotide--dimethylbenzimidazole phosphoribosyltransferase [Motilibacter rhizosphaerae]|uniref:nicotinate-nucleotide--dimethylbenzimidazole phosphoribosyltransferase n=1 Tax=Motilibacter rhizosphaerae TaxID=598652 RepID=UPI0038B3432A